MSDDLIERLRHPVNGMRPTRTDGRAAANALSAAQARIAELEAALTEIYEYPSGQPMALNMDEEGWQRHRAERMRYIAREALKSKGGELQPMRCAECNCETGGDDCNWVRSANERPKTSNADAWQLFLSECDYGHPYIAVQIAEAIDAAHERGRLQGLDEAVEVAKATEERCLRQRGDGPPLNAIDRENRLDWYNRSRGAKMTAESIIALKTKGGE